MYDPYLGITAHYIASPPGQPCEWELQSKIIGFEELKGRHSGANIASTMLDVLDHYEICDKVVFFFLSTQSNCMYLA
jgi:hypothetical protein